MNKVPIIFNMETADPDDVLTLCMLSTHPRVSLQGITITPGSIQQVALVSHVLHMLEIDVPIASKNINHTKACVSEWHYKWLGKIDMDRALKGTTAHELISSCVCRDPSTKIISGAGLGCIGQFLAKEGIVIRDHLLLISEIVIQGGFAGDSVVPIEHRLPKFAGKETCPTFNLNADREAAKDVINTNLIHTKRFVSKNVCHGVIYDQAMHERMKPHSTKNAGLNMMYRGMEHYLGNKTGKAFHDPLAACVAIDPTICEFREVEVYTQKGEWGSRLANNTNTFISVAVNRDKFEQVLVGDIACSVS
jgi:inosine-uridine nucleoside N-ribohydrolase